MKQVNKYYKLNQSKWQNYSKDVNFDRMMGAFIPTNIDKMYDFIAEETDMFPPNKSDEIYFDGNVKKYRVVEMFCLRDTKKKEVVYYINIK